MKGDMKMTKIEIKKEDIIELLKMQQKEIENGHQRELKLMKHIMDLEKNPAKR